MFAGVCFDPGFALLGRSVVKSIVPYLAFSFILGSLGGGGFSPLEDDDLDGCASAFGAEAGVWIVAFVTVGRTIVSSAFALILSVAGCKASVLSSQPSDCCCGGGAIG